MKSLMLVSRTPAKAKASRTLGMKSTQSLPSGDEEKVGEFDLENKKL